MNDLNGAGPVGAIPEQADRAGIARALLSLLIALAAGAAALVAAVLLAIPPARALLTAGSSGGAAPLTLASLAETSTIYGADGSVLGTLHGPQNRVPVTFSEVPQPVIDAVVDTEDAGFWYEGGVDLPAVVRAALADTGSGHIVQGASTITMQLAKNTVLSTENTRALMTKLREVALAARISRQMPKRQVLERYLNTIYFGNGAYGIGAAAETYFGEPVQKLTVVQGALLAGMISNPDGYDPFTNPAAARARRGFVLGRMVINDSITAAQAVLARSAPLPTRPRPLSPAPDGQNSYVVAEVTRRLLNDPQLGSTASQRYNAVFGGGLHIYTTLDPRMQTDAEIAVANNLPSDSGRWASALVAVDPMTGAVRALVGGPGFDRSQYDIATEGPGRQPGSSFKPIVLAAALKQGYSINASVNGTAPCVFPLKGAAPYVARNVEGDPGGWISLSSALAESVNCAYLRLGDDVGLANVVAMAKAMGITTPLAPYLSMSIGSETVRPIEMAGVYATFADNGIHHTPYLIAKVTDRHGKVLLAGGRPGDRVLTAQQAREAVVAMRDVMRYGTGTTANLADRPVAGKTGTTDNFTNAWFDGFSPQLATIVWMGSPVGDVPMTSVGGATATGQYETPRTVYGATYPSLIWHQFMESALAGLPVLNFTAPDPTNLGTIHVAADPTIPGDGAGRPCGQTTGCLTSPLAPSTHPSAPVTAPSTSTALPSFAPPTGLPSSSRWPAPAPPAAPPPPAPVSLPPQPSVIPPPTRGPRIPGSAP